MEDHDIRIFGEHEERVIEQLIRCAEVEEGSRAVLCADGHLGYSQPIGGAIAYREHISPSGVGYDIGCGNKAVMTNIRIEDIEEVVPKVMDEIFDRISFGMGRKNKEPIEHPVFDKIENASFEPQRKMLGLAREQLGTVGAGNHYVDLFRDEVGNIWIGVHFGSRGFGHKTASGFLSLAAGYKWGEKVVEGEMDSPPVVFKTTSELGQSYIEAMQLAGDYAYAGRDVVVAKVLEILGAEALMEVHNHHNYAWLEHHGGESWWVVRKGCTPAFPGQEGFVGATMGEESVILEGTDTGEEALFSTVHGAGRAMSRRQAAGKIKRIKVWECANRNCDRTFTAEKNQHPQKGICPDHPNDRVIKRWKTKQVKAGLIDFSEVQAALKELHIELRGGAADEAPKAYKRLNEVLLAQGDTIMIKHRLTPIGVAMAGVETFDAFKD